MTSFDNEGGHFYDASIPSAATLKYLAGGYGYWIYMTAADVLSIQGARVAAGAQVDLGVGWQLLTNWSNKCYYVTSEVSDPENLDVPDGVELVPVTSLNDVFGAPSAHLRIIANPSGINEIYDNQVDPDANTLHYLSPGCGLWIYVASDIVDFSWP